MVPEPRWPFARRSFARTFANVFLLPLLSVAVSWTLAGFPAVAADTGCGNGVCEADEEHECPSDCCGNGFCYLLRETQESCPADCGTCGDAFCHTFFENPVNCPGDCGTCGDNFCEPVDGIDCIFDCGECGDDVCSAVENTSNCYADCHCGNSICDSLQETSSDCAQDCFCGDSTCDAAENATDCSQDCGCAAFSGFFCGAPSQAPGGCYCDPSCIPNSDCCPDACTVCGTSGPGQACCGNGTCDPGETDELCHADCHCGNGNCEQDAGETADNCGTDCGCAAGNVCGMTAASGCGCDTACTFFGDCCPDVCSACGVNCCGNGICDSGETLASCPGDCTCGNGVCDAGESDTTCSQDCGCQALEVCDGPAPSGCSCVAACESGGNCCADACAVCGATVLGDDCCGNGTCDPGEDFGSCPAECSCGNGKCEPGEPIACQDCACDDGVCSPGETAESCLQDCGCAFNDGQRCGLGSPSGCFCDFDCFTAGDCCPDVCDACALSGCCGNGVVNPGEQCDGGDCCTSGCAYEPAETPCTSDSAPCTDDLCDASGTCNHDPNAVPCDDGKLCTGNDVCSDGACGGSPIVCGQVFPCAPHTCVEVLGCVPTLIHEFCQDAFACTIDLCTAEAGCTRQLDHSQCDDGVYCNGAEVCDANNGCVAGTPVSCADTVACTIDSCIEETDSCALTIDHGACADGLFCNGDEVCLPTQGCSPGTAPDCADEVACTLDACSEATDTCSHQEQDFACQDDIPCSLESCDAEQGCVIDSTNCVPGVCGNSVVNLEEVCDDGNTAALDGCDGCCRNEASVSFVVGADETITAGFFGLVVRVTSPNAELVTITSTCPVAPMPPGWTRFGPDIVTEPPAATAADPLVNVFEIYEQIAPDGLGSAFVQFLADGVPVPPCKEFDEADPDPCMLAGNEMSISGTVQRGRSEPTPPLRTAIALSTTGKRWSFAYVTGQCGDGNGSGTINATDALYVLRGSIKLLVCPLTICDVDDNGRVLATDALAVLRRAVNLPVMMNCGTVG